MVFLLVLLAIFLLTVKADRKLPNQLFAAFLIVTAFDFSGFFLAGILEKQSQVNYLKVASVLLQMPLFYIYVRSACYHTFQLKPKHLVHAIPFAVFYVVFVVSKLSDATYLPFEAVAKVQYYGYIIAVFVLLRNYKRVYLKNYSRSDRSAYRWLLQTTILFLIGNSFVTIRQVFESLQGNTTLSFLNLLISLFGLFVICFFVLKALYQPKLFSGVDGELKSETLPQENTEDHQEELNMLSNYMQKEKPFLDAELTLQKLASQVGIPEKQVSFLINHQMDSHFFDYINNFRIEEAKDLLKNKKELTVLEILYQVGFNSKSSFYTAFKKETHQTPTTYRNQ
jgi:AraC-like DNA-binding protein